jgi:hypothetical protein
MIENLDREFRAAAERIEDEHEAPHRAEVRAIQEALALDVAAARAVLSRPRALDTTCSDMARETLALLADRRFDKAKPSLREKIRQARDYANMLLQLVSQADGRATEAVRRVEGFTYEHVKSWAQPEFIRCEREKLQMAASSPLTIKEGPRQLKTLVAEIRDVLSRDAALANPASSGAELTPERTPQQTHATREVNALGEQK